MDLNLTLPASSRLLVQLVRLLGNVDRAEIRLVRMNNASHAEQSDVNVLAMRGVQRENKCALSRLDHGQRDKLRQRLLVELRGACDDE